MADDTDRQSQILRLWRWIKTPPQVYVAYLVGLLLVWMVSFYAGTLNPRHGSPFGPPQVAAPKN